MDLAEAKKEEGRFLAFMGTVQWARSCSLQAIDIMDSTNLPQRIAEVDRFRFVQGLFAKTHLFVVSAGQLIDYRDWTNEYPALHSIDFSEIDAFDRQKLRDLRNMHEHRIAYWREKGNNQDRYMYQSEYGSAGASAIINTKIGGRLDYIQFGSAAGRLTCVLEAMPVPYPSMEASTLLLHNNAQRSGA